jgi:hypothetical protein
LRISRNLVFGPLTGLNREGNKRVQFGYGLNCLFDVEHAIIVDVEVVPTRTFDEVAATRTMLERAEKRRACYTGLKSGLEITSGLRPQRLATG